MDVLLRIKVFLCACKKGGGKWQIASVFYPTFDADVLLLEKKEMELCLEKLKTELVSYA